jgi:hypothetical protein
VSAVRPRRRAPAAGLPPELEEDFQDRVMKAAKLYGWKVVHFRPARVGTGKHARFVTALRGDKGAPDLILARDHVVILAELKRDTTYPTPEQRGWLAAIGPEIGRVWRPRDWETIVAELSRRG